MSETRAVHPVDEVLAPGRVVAYGLQQVLAIYAGVIVAVSIAFGVIPAAVPEFYDEFPQAVRMIFESGITAASVAAILLNVVFKRDRGQERARRYRRDNSPRAHGGGGVDAPAYGR